MYIKQKIKGFTLGFRPDLYEFTHNSIVKELQNMLTKNDHWVKLEKSSLDTDPIQDGTYKAPNAFSR